VAVEIQVLGAVAIRRHGPNPDNGTLSDGQRRLLGVLCAQAGRVVPAERLVEALGVASLVEVRAAVAELHDLVGDIIRNEPPGYSVVADAVDSQRFLRLVTEARSLDSARAADVYDEALRLWRGPAFAEFADEEWAGSEAQRLDALRTKARAERAALSTAAREREASGLGDRRPRRAWAVRPLRAATARWAVRSRPTSTGRRR